MIDARTDCPPPTELAGYLDESLGRAAADAIEWHIDGCPACQAEMDRLTAANPAVRRLADSDSSASAQGDLTLPPSAPAAPAGPETQLLAGQVGFAPPQLVLRPAIPGFEVGAEIGRGGMGVVYRATHRRLNRPVAIKMVLAGGLADPRTTQRFLFEAEVLARVAHPQVVRVYEVAMYHAPTGVAVPYLAMELLDGGTLHDTVRGPRLAPLDAAALIEGLARAAHAAHAQGVVHRDIKPANVMRAPGGAFKLADFGLAKLIAGVNSGLTGTGAVVGTPSYMAPEQAAGAKEIGPAADIYSLGAVLYELLTGRPPFAGGEPMSVLLRVIHESPSEVRAAAPGVPRDLAAAAMKCLAKKPAHRYATAEALADDLARVREGKPTLARPLRRGEKLLLWARRNPVVTGLLAALAVAVVAGLVGTAALYLRAEERAATATANGLRAERNEVSAERDRAEADRAGAYLAFRQGLARGDQDQIDQAMVLFLDALERAERLGDAELARVIRVNIRNWSRYLFPPGRRVEFAPPLACTAAAYSPDGAHFALCGDAQAVRVYDSISLELVATLSVHDSPRRMALAWLAAVRSLAEPRGGGWAGWGRRVADAVGAAIDPLYGKSASSVCFDATGVRVIAGQADDRVAVWDWRSGRLVGRYRGARPYDATGAHFTQAVAAAPGGLVWSAEGQGRLRCWNPDTGRVVREVAAGGSVGGVALKPWPVTRILVQPGGKSLLVGDRGGQVVEWDAATGKPTAAWQTDNWVSDLASAPLSAPPHAFALNKTGRAYELTYAQGAGGRGVASFTTELNMAKGQSLALSPDSRVVALGDGDGNVTLLDTYIGRGVAAPLRAPGELRLIRFRPGSREFLILSGTGVRVQELPWPPAIPYPLPEVAVTALGSRRAPNSADPGAIQVMVVAGRAVSLFDARTAAVVAQGNRPGGLTAAALHPTRDAVLCGAVGGWAELALAPRKVVASHAFPDQLRVTSFAVRPGGEVFADLGDSVWVYPAGVGRPVARKIPLGPAPSESAGWLAFARGGAELLVARGRRVDFLDPDTGAARRPGLVAPDEILAASYLDATRTLATAYRGRSAQVWDLSREPPVPGPPLNHSRAVISVALRPDGRAVLTGSRDGNAQVWDVASGLELGPKFRHRGPVTAVAWSADPRLAFTGAAEGEAAGWPVETEPEPGTLAELSARYRNLPNNSVTD